MAVKVLSQLRKTMDGSRWRELDRRRQEQRRRIKRLSKSCSVLTAAAAVGLGVLLTAASPRAAALTVFDPQNLAEMLVENISTIEQWGVDNQKQIEHLTELRRANDLSEINSALTMQDSWNEIEAMRAESLQLVNAAAAMWRQYGDLAQFFSSMKSADAWVACFKSAQCSFERYMQDIDEQLIESAEAAAVLSQDMQGHLKQKADVLKELKTEGRNVQGQAEILDNLSKINAETASSLIDLNQQSTVLVQLVSQNQALRADERQAQRAKSQAFRTTDGWGRGPDNWRWQMRE